VCVCVTKQSSGSHTLVDVRLESGPGRDLLSKGDGVLDIDGEGSGRDHDGRGEDSGDGSELHVEECE